VSAVHLVGDPSWQFLSKNLLLFLYPLFIIFAKSIWATGRLDPHYFVIAMSAVRNAAITLLLSLRGIPRIPWQSRVLETVHCRMKNNLARP
ncbi:MAG: hypothetical protein WAN57_00765, partial [Smithella sp.]